ncbi:hypothetical protein [Pseudokineococcus sp. 1T1Z-3]|uniref:hypothetical protein n=1 Tax=Pseudokineococcus sp. 1T1Z-3 TaxID=3132745 RepID=UPI0030D8F591
MSLVSQPEARFSTTWAVDAAVTSLLVVWPLSAGLAAADAVRVRRTGGALVDALPAPAVVRLLWRRAAAAGAWTAAGLGIAAAGGAVVGAAHGSPPTLAAFTPVAPAVAGSFAVAALGAALGVLLPSWLLPPLLAAGSYAFLAFDVAGAQSLVGLVGATSGVVLGLEVGPVALGARVVALSAAAAAAAVVLAWSATRRPWLLAPLLGVAVLAAGAWALADMDDPYGHWRSDADWPCADVPGAGGLVCVPSDQRRDVEVLAEALSPVSGRLTQLDPARADQDFSATRASRADALLVPLPFGRPVDEPSMADAVAAELAPCLRGDRDLSAREEEDVFAAVVTTAWWLAPGREQDPALLESLGLPDSPPTRAEAQRAYDVITTCR